MSTKQNFNSKSDIEQLRSLKSLRGVGDKTIERLEKSDSYDCVSDVQEADPVALKQVIGLNYADAIWIQIQLENSRNGSESL